MNNTKLIPANSPSFEYVYVANQRCECGSTFACVSQQLRNPPSGPVDRLIARCEGCSVERSFEFDISSFFGQFDKYAGYHQTDDLFRQAMRHVSADRMNQAEEALRRVVDPEEGEPAFAWGHYHLGVVLFVQGRLDEAATHLEQAITIQPLEPEIQEALGRTWRALGREAEGEKHLRQAERLRVRFAPSDSSEDPS